MKGGDGRAVGLFLLMVLLGGGLLAIPFAMTPPAALEIAPRDPIFGSDLVGRTLRVTDVASGASLTATIEKGATGYVARLGRIDSGPAAFRVEIPGYDRGTATVNAAPLQVARAAVDMMPAFGRLEVSVVDATRTGRAVAATLKEGRSALATQPQSVVNVDLPGGSHQVTAEAAGFCAAERKVEVAPRKVTRLTIPLSPHLAGNEIARLVLDWGENPRDLDAHFRRVGTGGGSTPEHVFFHQLEGRANGKLTARLDVDYRRSEGYETVTVFEPAQGEFEYWVHRYAGDGTLGTSGAHVTAFTRSCEQRSYTVPAGCAKDIWAVTNLRVAGGTITFVDEQACEEGTFDAGRKRQ